VVLKKNKHEHKDAKIKQVWYDSVMLTRPAGHKAKAQAEARKSGAEDEAEAQNFFFEAEATMCEAEAEARHVREQLSVYEHEH